MLRLQRHRLGRSYPSRPGLTYIIPCSNILASLRSLRNCAWNDIGKSRAGGYSLETIFTFLVSRCDEGTPPLSHRLTVFIFSGSPLQILLEGNLV